MIGAPRLSLDRVLGPAAWRSIARPAAWIAAAIVTGAAVAWLVAGGYWYLALAIVLALPAIVLLVRYPLATVVVWLLITPFVSVTDQTAVRHVFWVVHRGLPLAALLAVVLGSIAGVDRRRLPRLGWPEALMGGYVVATALSIAYTSETAAATVTLAYERIVIPMCLYVLVRLLRPSEHDLRRLVPVAWFVLITQSIVGIVSWIAPSALPSMWLAHAGLRTDGTFGDPDVFGATILVAGLFLLSTGVSAARRDREVVVAILAFIWAVLMTFLTFSRGNWLAGLVVVAGVLIIFRRYARFLVATLATVLLLLLASGTIANELEFAERRLTSAQAEESALARLPVAVAALRMFEEKPVAGWGYGSFDLYSRPFQARVGSLVSPEKPHASHNLFLTVAAEQGTTGLVLFLGPMALLLVRSLHSSSSMSEGRRRLVWSLWLGVAVFVIVNNFSVMKEPFGLGLWWLALGTIATLVARSRPASGQGGDPV